MIARMILSIVDGLIIGSLPHPLFEIAMLILFLKLHILTQIMDLPEFYLLEENRTEAAERFNKKPKFIRHILLYAKKYSDAKTKFFKKFP